MNHHRASRPRRSSTAHLQSDNPMNLPRARRFPIPRNDLPSNCDDLFELVVQTTTSVLTQNLRIEELIPILRQLRNRRAQDISTVLADVTQLLERDLLALVGLSEAITRIPTTPPVAQPTPAASSRRRTRRPVVLEDTDEDRTPHPARATLLCTGSCFECFSLDIFASTVVGTNVPCVTPPVQDTSPDSALFASSKKLRTHLVSTHRHFTFLFTPMKTPRPGLRHLNVSSLQNLFVSLHPAPQYTEEDPDPNILIDSRLLTSPKSQLKNDSPWSTPMFYPIEIVSPTLTRFAPVVSSPLHEYLVYSNSLTPQSPARSSPEPESPTSTSLHSQSTHGSDGSPHLTPSPVNGDDEDSARSF
ncbi:hypothetical protein BU15DRAFT_81922 [Melanogaster broomeanus]|nr:hypothetical protein BU15DRAFT_81922 [Melanogaster broomeanus]